MQVLLVDDTDDLRNLFARALAHYGFDVREARNGQEALDCVQDLEPDLVITDVMMPVLGGIELIRRLRTMPGLEAVPIVAISSAATAATEREAREAGAVDFIEKPVEIAAMVERLYGQRR